MKINRIIVDIIETSNGVRPIDEINKKLNKLTTGTGGGGGMGDVILPPSILTPTNNATNIVGPITSSPYKTDPSYVGLHLYSDWETSTDAGFKNIVDQSMNDKINLLSYTPSKIPGGVIYYTRVRYGSDRFVSKWSNVISYTPKNVYISAPSVSVSGGPSNIGRSTVITCSPFTVVGGTDIHASTNWKIIDPSGTIVHSSISDTINLTKYAVPYGVLKPATTYTFDVVYNGKTIASSASGIVTGTTITTFPVITRGVIAGGRTATATVAHIEYLTIPNLSNCAVFGALKSVRFIGVGVSDGNRGVICNGSSVGATSYILGNEYITIGTAGNALAYSNVYNLRAYPAGVNDPTTGVIAGGHYYGTYFSNMEYIKIATLSTSKTFGSLSLARSYLNGISGNGRGGFVGGHNGKALNTMSYITIATLGNSLLFGTLTNKTHIASTMSSNGRGIISGGSNGVSNIQTIDYVDMSVLGNSKQLGKLTTARNNGNGVADNTKGVIPGGNSAITGMRDMEYINTQTLGNATSFGKLIVGRYGAAAVSGT